MLFKWKKEHRQVFLIGLVFIVFVSVLLILVKSLHTIGRIEHADQQKATAISQAESDLIKKESLELQPQGSADVKKESNSSAKEENTIGYTKHRDREPTPIIRGIKDSDDYLVSDFLSEKDTLNQKSIDFIKKITLYDSRISAFGRHSAWINTAQDFANPNLLYFMDYRYILEYKINQPDIYSLNLKTNEIKDLYKATSNSHMFQLVGIQSNRLLFFKRIQDDSPGPCFNLWVDVYEHHPPVKSAEKYYQNDGRTIKSLDVHHPEKGFANFSIPKEKYLYEVKQQKACADKFNKQEQPNN